jgi:hypothetical protein
MGLKAKNDEEQIKEMYKLVTGIKSKMRRRNLRSGINW